MKTNLNMIETRNVGNNIGATSIGVINNAVLNNMALQQLLATKNDAEIAEFEQSTGWSWLTACTTALEADPSLAAKVNEDFERQFEIETGWTYSDAVEMALESRREDRLFGNGRRYSRTNRSRPSSLSCADKFERETGWNLGDAIDMAAESRRDDRLFGGRLGSYLN